MTKLFIALVCLGIADAVFVLMFILYLLAKTSVLSEEGMFTINAWLSQIPLACIIISLIILIYF